MVVVTALIFAHLILCTLMKLFDVRLILNLISVGSATACVKACPQNAIDVRGYADFAPMGHSVRVLREEEKGTISWKIKFRNGTVKDFVSPITTKPWGKHIPKLAEKEKPSKEALDSQLLYSEPKGLNIDTGLPEMKKEKFKQGVYY